MNSNSFFPLLVLGFACLILGWKLRQKQGLSRLNLLSWLQSLMLVLPWLVYFGLFLSGTFINLAMLLLAISTSTIAFIWLGGEIRKIKAEQTTLDPNSPKTKIEVAEFNNIDRVDKSLKKAQEQPEEKLIPKIQPEEIKKMQGIFGIDTFYATEMISYQQGLVFRGNMRGEADEVYAHLSAGLSDRLGDKYELFLLPSQDLKPVVMILPNKAESIGETTPQKVLVGVLVVSTLLTCLTLGAQLAGVNLSGDLSIDLNSHPEQFLAGIPFGLGIGSILLAREVGWRWMGHKQGVKLGLPFCLPSSQLGAFGAYSRIQSSLPNRQVLFDLAIAPAISGGLVSLIFLEIGLFLSGHHDGNLQIPSQIFQASVLVGILGKLTLGSTLHIDLIEIHPLVVLGWLGLVITALNLLPAGQLDGGRIIQAMYGRRTAGVATVLTLIVLAIATLINPLALYWGGIILILLRDQEGLMHNELSELDGDRDALGIFALFWMLITLLPMTAVVAEKLGIGG
jgi:membrane-associated protease RseP (regulator of RpoE activity)